MKSALFALFLSAVGISSAHAETVYQCATDNVSQGGVRLNVIHSERFGYRANLIFGTTVSGQMYRVDKTAEGYKGDSRDLPLELRISSTLARNKYVEGYAASLVATYIDLRNPSKKGEINTAPSDNFVCGKQIRPYRD